MINLPMALNIENKSFQHILESIKFAVEDIWSGAILHGHFTNHNVYHSEKIIKLVGQLLEEYSALLNEKERFILVAAILLHDIGMQFPEYSGLTRKTLYSLDELNTIREQHHIASEKIILAQNSHIQLGLERCERNLINFIATVAKFHRKEDILFLEDVSVAGDDVRLPLLAALIRLGDELDADYERINSNILARIDIPVESKYHWWSHLYIQSITIKGGRIKVFFTFPVEYTGISNYFKILKAKTIDSIKKQLLEVYDILYQYGIRLHPDIEVSEKFLSGLQLMPGDLVQYITNKIIKLDGEPTKTIYSLGDATYSDDPYIINCLNTIHDRFVNEEYKEAINQIQYGRTLTMNPKDRIKFLVLSANIYSIIGKIEKAHECCEDIFQIISRKEHEQFYSIEFREANAAAEGIMGYICDIRGDYENAIEHLNNAINVWYALGWKSNLAISYGNIGNIYNCLGDVEHALDYYMKAKILNEEIGVTQALVNDIANIGITYYHKGEIASAINFLNEAYEKSKLIGYKGGEILYWSNMAFICEDSGQISEALVYQEKALMLAIETSDLIGQAKAIGNIGLIYASREQFDLAIENHNKALKIYESIGSKKGIAINLGNLGILYEKKGDRGKALQLIKQALEIDKQINYLKGQAVELHSLAQIYRQDYTTLDLSLDFENEALIINTRINDKKGEAICTLGLGLLYGYKNTIGKAIETFTNALDIFRSINNKEGQAACLQNMGLFSSVGSSVNLAR